MFLFQAHITDLDKCPLAFQHLSISEMLNVFGGRQFYKVTFQQNYPRECTVYLFSTRNVGTLKTLEHLDRLDFRPADCDKPQHEVLVPLQVEIIFRHYSDSLNDLTSRK